MFASKQLSYYEKTNMVETDIKFGIDWFAVKCNFKSNLALSSLKKKKHDENHKDKLDI